MPLTALAFLASLAGAVAAAMVAAARRRHHPAIAPAGIHIGR